MKHRLEQLQEQLKQTQVDAELKVAMLSAGAKADDIDYLTFKLNSKGKSWKLVKMVTSKALMK